MSEASVPLIVRRTNASPRTKIFDAFADKRVLPRWFVPDRRIGLEILEFEFRSEGRFRFRYHLPDGRCPTVSGRYTGIEAPLLISQSWVWEPPDPLEDILMHVTFRFLEIGDSTEVVITHEQLPTTSACTIHEDGWGAALLSLEQFLLHRNERMPRDA